MSAYDFSALIQHVGHDVEVVQYSRGHRIYNVAVECLTCNEVLLDYDNPAEEEKVSGDGKWVKGDFTIDDMHTMKGYYIPGNTWNGWQTPLFEKDELIRWLKLEIPDSSKIEYIEQMDAIYCPEEGNDPDHQLAIGVNIDTEDGTKRLYGPDGWTWDLVPPCECGHTREAHILGGEGRCGLCDCRIFRS